MTETRKRRERKPPPKPRDPTEVERLALEAAASELAKRPARVAVDQTEKPGGVLAIGPAHADHKGWQDQFVNTFGTSSHDFADQAMVRISNAIIPSGAQYPPEKATNSALAIMGAIAPSDELEAILGEQIIAAHVASLDFLHRARRNAGQNFEASAAYANMAAKMTRSMTAAVEALGKHRSGGKQQVVVKHVYVQGNAYVGDGGQAAFGVQRGGGGPTFLGQPDALSPALWSENAGACALPSASDPRQAPMPDARRQESGRATGVEERELSTRLVHAGASRGPQAAPGDKGDDR
nr:hypothetical protein [Phenylobacterium sp.]